MNQDESLKCLELSRMKFSEGDMEASLRLAIKAHRMFESDETKEWLDKVRSASSDYRPAGEGPQIRQRTTVESVKTESVKIEEVRSTLLYSEEQAKEVREFSKRNKNDYYVVLGVDKSATVDEIKKSYKKLALKFHPDKNQAPGADEAFKTISVAFSVLGDEEKRRNYDRFGVGGVGGVGASSPFGGHGGGPPFGFNFHDGGGEISPEDLFRMFFESAFTQGPQAGFGGPGQFFFSTNFGGQPHHFNRTSQRRRQAAAQTDPEETLRKIIQFVPLIIVFILSLLSSWLFSGGSEIDRTDLKNLVNLNPTYRHPYERTTRSKQIPYFATYKFHHHFDNLKESDKSSRLARELASYEEIIEKTALSELKKSCESEQKQLERLLKRAKKDEMEEIRKGFILKSCDKLKSFEK